MSQKEKIAEELGVDVEDLCVKCGEDEIFGETLCVGCLEEENEDEE